MRVSRILAVYFLDALQFRLRGLVWLLTGAVNVLILLFFWWAVLQLSGGQSSGFNLGQITTYYLVMLTFSALTSCHNEEFIAFRQIYLGQIHQYLLQPFPYLARVFQQELVWRMMQGFFSILILAVVHLTLTPIKINFHPLFLLVIPISLVLAMVLSFLFKSSIGLMAFWFTNIHGLLEITGVIELLFSGYLLPLHLYSESIRTFLLYSPFGAMTYAPVSILVGYAAPDSWLLLLLVQLFWVLVFAVIANLIFRRGVRYFGGVSQ